MNRMDIFLNSHREIMVGFHTDCPKIWQISWKLLKVDPNKYFLIFPYVYSTYFMILIKTLLDIKIIDER